ncbi:hypothetical protein HOY82DRAFT_188524 [Tuber indicum]|nr:hypothetical protein HOY82DRAFT_188524 [Tuber indicum]
MKDKWESQFSGFSCIGVTPPCFPSKWGCSGARGYKGVQRRVVSSFFSFLLHSFPFFSSFLVSSLFILPPLEGGFWHSSLIRVKYLSLATFLFIPSLPFFTHPVTVTVDDSGTRVLRTGTGTTVAFVRECTGLILWLASYYRGRGYCNLEKSTGTSTAATVTADLFIDLSFPAVLEYSY